MSNPEYIDPHFEDSTSNILSELALNLRWSFNHSADKVWEQLDPELWELTHNPWVVLVTVSRERLRKIMADPDFHTLLADLHRQQQAAESSARWFQLTHPDSSLKAVAYFSMEFMLSEALPIYSGGLGNVAGDQLKAASDLGVPVVGVGLLYQQGYFRQEIDAQGRQQALYPFNDPSQLPITPLREPNGEWLRLAIDFGGARLWIRTWQVQVGRTKLYLLDTNDPANLPANRGITSELYGGGPELRLKQEQVLGIGGWRLLRALGLQPEVCHLNEGHAAFAVLERARCYMADNKQPFDLALTITRPGNLFTTHTAVSAGFDLFAPELMNRYFRRYAEEELSISLHDLLALGRRDPNDSKEPFNMAYLAARGSLAINGVSRLHGAVSRRIFQVLFPRWPESEVPVTHITNGVHTPSWDSAEADRLWHSACPKERWRGTMDELEKEFRSVDDSAIWEMRAEARQSLIQYVRERLIRQASALDVSADVLARAEQTLDANNLTMGFARRFATYKRPNLLLHDRERLLRIVTNREHPVQLIVAGKAHPEDAAGQRMIQEWVQFSSLPEVRSRVVFLSDYDVLMAERLVQGIDLWINTPRRPWEASGTSGMKVLVNGGLNCSELDGWWAEAYSPEVGWALGDGKEHGDDPAWDAREAEELYRLLEQEIIPAFYARDEKGIPRAWVARIRESMAMLTATFSANRVVREYTEKCYLPAAAAYCGRAANQGRPGKELQSWRAELGKHWPALRYGTASVSEQGGEYAFDVQVYLDELNPEAVRVELYANGQNGGPPERHSMNRGQQLIGSANGFVYSVRIPTNRPATEYTPRLIPCLSTASVPLECNLILWHTSPGWRPSS